MKNYKLFNEGDKVIILHSHSDDINQVGTIIEVRHSFCKIKLDSGVIKNHIYGQFKLIQDSTTYK